MNRLSVRGRAAALVGVLALAGCSPALNWRETRAEGSGIVAMFPCKPDRHVRDVRVAGLKVRMEMLVCAADGATYAIGFFDVNDELSVAAAMMDLRRLASANLGADQSRADSASVVGMTPNPLAGKVLVRGKRPDGAAVEGQTLLFTKGLRIYQAQVIGSTVPDNAAETFFSGLEIAA